MKKRTPFRAVIFGMLIVATHLVRERRSVVHVVPPEPVEADADEAGEAAKR